MTEGPEDWTRQRIEAELKSDVPNITIEDGLWLLERCRPCVKCGRYPATICQGNYDIIEQAMVVAMKELDRANEEIDRLRAEGPHEPLHMGAEPEASRDPIADHMNALFKHYGSAEAVYQAVRAALSSSRTAPSCIYCQKGKRPFISGGVPCHHGPGQNIVPYPSRTAPEGPKP